MKYYLIQESLENTTSLGKLIITKSDHSNKLLTIIFKNCDLLSKHFNILIKPELNTKSKEEKKKGRKNKKAFIIYATKNIK